MTISTFPLSLLQPILACCPDRLSQLPLTKATEMAFALPPPTLATQEAVYKFLTCILFIVTLLLSTALFLLMRKNKSRLLKPQDTIDDNPARNVRYIRAQLRDEFLSALDKNRSYDISPVILESEAYEKILQSIRKDRIIPEKSPIWEELESVVIQTSPDFKYKLHILTGGRLKPSDFHLAMLIKCGISPSNIAILVGRAKATIAYRREALGLKIFDQKLSIDAIDHMIRLL